MESLPPYYYDQSNIHVVAGNAREQRAERIKQREARRIEREQAKASFLKLVGDLADRIPTATSSLFWTPR